MSEPKEGLERLLAEAGRLEVAGHWAECLAVGEEALRLAPSSAYGWGIKGHALYGLGRFAEAAAAHERAVELAPDNASMWRGLALCYRQLGRRSEDLAACERSLALDPTPAGAWEEKTLTLCVLKRRDEALAAAKEAVARSVSDAEVFRNQRNVGLVLYGLGRLPEAVTALDQALVLMPNDWRTIRTKSSLLFKMHKLRESFQWWRRAEELRQRAEDPHDESDDSDA